MFFMFMFISHNKAQRFLSLVIFKCFCFQINIFDLSQLQAIEDEVNTSFK